MLCLVPPEAWRNGGVHPLCGLSAAYGKCYFMIKLRVKS